MIGFGDALKMFIARYTDFQGRSSRAEYWWVVLAVSIVFGIGAVLAMVLGGALDSGGMEGMNPIGWVLIAILGIAYLAIIIPMIALGVRRFHDLNQTGWLYLVFILVGFIPLVGTIAGLGQLIWFCMPGTKGPNKYGQDPYGGMDVGAFD